MAKKFSDYINQAVPASGDKVLFENSGATDSFNTTFAQFKAAASGSFNADLPGAGLVLDLSSNVLSSIVQTGEKISSWTDQKNGLVASQATPANQPTLEMDGIRFNVTTYLDIPAFIGLNLTSAMSIFIVSTADDVVTNPFSTVFQHCFGAAGYTFGYGNTPPGEARFNFPGVSDKNANVVSWESGRRSSVGVVFGAGSFDYQKNSHKLGTTQLTANANPINTFTRIGSDQNGLNGWVGTINRILVYNTKLSGANLTAVGDGLINEWST